MAERDPKTGRFPRGNGAGHGGPRNGEGWGGSAKGASTAPRLGPAGDPESDAIRALLRDPANMEAKAEFQAEMLAIQIGIARGGESEANRLNAADKVLDRLGGKPKQQTDITTGGERIGYVIPAPPESPDAETWAQQYQPRH